MQTWTHYISNGLIAPDVYTKTEVNDIFDATTNVTGRYILIETNALFVAKVDKIDIIYAYSYAETDSKLDGKVDKSELIDAYTSSEDDALLQLKVEKIDLMN
ncbi:MAG: hypothetical protein EZS28_008157 [Streblomastix strix]|uniref:Uncharacterized protein n=1 Tax=Streblomastix strix TaxID=222440 RepID=A0A5J4WQ95_9EUKA|nr:MAG: hypothetical protein EZS28_008157 [Streblomastix strix]